VGQNGTLNQTISSRLVEVNHSSNVLSLLYTSGGIKTFFRRNETLLRSGRSGLYSQHSGTFFGILEP